VGLASLLTLLSLVGDPAHARVAGLTQTLRQETSTLATLESLTDWVVRSGQDLETAKVHQQQMDHQIAEARRRLAALELRASDRRRHVGARVRSLYKLSRGGVVRLLFEALDTQDLSLRLSTAAFILRRDVREMEIYRGETALLLEEKRTLEKKQAQQASARQQLEAKVGELQRARSAQLQILGRLQASRRLRSRVSGELDQQQRALLRRIEVLHTRLDDAGGFARQRGQLARPVSGPVIGIFGGAVDPERGVSILRHGLTFRPHGSRASVRAVAEGRVIVAGPFAGFGKLVLLEHTDGYFSVYGFLSSTAVAERATVRRGQTLGRVGLDPLTGRSALYFELRHNERPLDPAVWIRR
jgi:septal ring factor EnvC (AmiA/AmiB activator)